MEAERLMDEVRQELNDLIHQLRPVALEDEDLASALRQYVTEWAHQNDIKVDVRIHGEGTCPLEVEHALFRIAQEALSNIARHSHARRAELALACGTDAITLTLSDDGRGFDTSAPTSGLGLRSMRERAEALGGKLTIESAPGQGTRISVSYERHIA
jgi:NarL family two-component system sensor histidine kinase LiaS